MSMNAGKCEVLYFHSDQVTCKAMYTLGEYGLVPIMVKERGVQVMKSLPWKDRARYLGLHYGPGTTFESCTDELYTSGQRALFSLVSKLRRQGLFVPAVAVRAFDAQVRSILSYGVQVWGPAMVLQVLERGYPSNQEPRSCYFEYALQNRMVELQKSFLKQLTGAGLPPNRLLFRESGQYPLQMYWAKLIFRFWNRLVEAKGTVYHHCFREELRLAFTSFLTYDGWGTKVIRILEAMGDDLGLGTGDAGTEARVDAVSSHVLDIKELMEGLRSRFDDDWSSVRLAVDPRVFISDNMQPGVKMCRYLQWMGQPKHCRGYILPKQHVTLMRFRMCVWPLAVNRPHGREREARWCQVCGNQQAVEDERHVLLECPVYADIRTNLWNMGATPGDRMDAVMGIENQRGLAQVLDCIRRRRSQYAGELT